VEDVAATVVRNIRPDLGRPEEDTAGAGHPWDRPFAPCQGIFWCGTKGQER
jgi:hypothetical protein